MLTLSKYTFVAAALIASLLVVSFSRNALWRNDRTIWTDSLEKSPDKVRGLNELGIYYVNNKEYGRALSVLTKSIVANRYQPTVYINLGLAYEGLNRFEEAEAMYRAAAAYQPSDPIPYYNLGVLYYNRMHDNRRAFEMFRKARDLAPLEPDVHLYLSDLYRDEGELRRSAEEHERYIMLK